MNVFLARGNVILNRNRHLIKYDMNKRGDFDDVIRVTLLDNCKVSIISFFVNGGMHVWIFL